MSILRRPPIPRDLFVSPITSFFLAFSLVFSFSAHAKNKKLIFAIDGLSYEAFEVARARGLFASFGSSGRHISTYPSMTEPAWTEALGGKKLFPVQANVKTVEAKYFDVDSMTTHDDPRTLFIRYSNPYNYYRAFDYYFNPILEGLMYFPNESLLAMEMEQIEREVESQFSADHFTAYVSSVDAIAHTQPNRLFPTLEKISAMIDRIRAKLSKKGEKVESWILSDHGNAGAFAEGTEERFLSPIKLDAAIAAGGFEFSAKPEKPNQVAMPIMALGNMATVYFKDLDRRRDFATAALQHPAVELVTWGEFSGPQRKIVIMGTQGDEANVYWEETGMITYHAIRGNPLGLSNEVISRGTNFQKFSDKRFFEESLKTKYPDSLNRLIQSARGQVAAKPDLILNLREGFYFEGDFSKYVTMVRTHGGLSARSSLGVLATDQKIEMRTHYRGVEILGAIGLSPAESFHQSKDLFQHRPVVEVLADAKAAGKNGIKTQINNLSGDILFRRTNKVIQATYELLSQQDTKDIIDAFLPKKNSAADQTKTDDVIKILKKWDPSELLEHGLDKLAGIKTLALTLKPEDDIYTAVMTYLKSVPGLGIVGEIERIVSAGAPDSQITKQDGRVVLSAFRKLVMKLYTFPFFLNEILNIPEGETVPEVRSLPFAESWHVNNKWKFMLDPTQALDQPETVRKLFSEIFIERQLLAEISPATTPVLYNPAPRDVTVVFVPGIYNELFDTEIFSRGLKAITDRLGLRVIYADVDGRCATDYNAEKLTALLKEDTKNRLARGYTKPKYVIFGYSKGGVDATEALLIDETFTRNQIVGLVSLDSPHMGTRLLESADVPKIASQGMVVRPIPAECVERTAVNSLRKSNREKFWDANIGKLAGITRFYNLTFASEIKNSHPWMKISKQIARFNAPNSGVAPSASTKFPAPLQSLDLGTVSADHLPGILASDFPQAAFMEALTITLIEIGALNSSAMRRDWFTAVSQRSSALLADYYRRSLFSTLMDASNSTNALRIPSQPVKSSEYDERWQNEIANTRAALNQNIECASPARAGDFSKALQRQLKSSALALKPLTLECSADGGVKVQILVKKRPLLKLWQSPIKLTQTVTTYSELVDLLLSKGLASGQDVLHPQEGVALPKSERPPVQLPQNNLSWNEDKVIDLKKMSKLLEKARIAPFVSPEHAEGIQMIFDHQKFRDFRTEHQLSYESTSPEGADENTKAGCTATLDKIGDKLTVVGKIKSSQSSIRLTTMAYRFKPAEFPEFSLKLKVTQGVPGANPATGKDDSAFQVWFTVRNLKNVKDRSSMNSDESVKVFGYHWGDEDEHGKLLAPGTKFENSWSKVNLWVTTLPEAWQIMLEGGKASQGRWFDFKRNLFDDLKSAFPSENTEDLEVVAITIQGDSDNTGLESEAYFKSLSIGPVQK